MKVIVRKPSDADLQGVDDLIRKMEDAFTSEGKQLLGWDSRRHNVLIAEVNADMRGLIVWVESAAEMEILWLAVDPAYRRRGIGRFLVDSVKQQSTGNQRILLAKTADPGELPSGTTLTSENFRSAVAFFRRLGFDIEARIPNYWGPGNSALLLAKRLWKTDA